MVFRRIVGFLANHANTSMFLPPLCAGASDTRKAPAPGATASCQTKATLAFVPSADLANCRFFSFMRQALFGSFFAHSPRKSVSHPPGCTQEAHDARRHVTARI